MVKYFCDRCGAQTLKTMEKATLGPNVYDLCVSCANHVGGILRGEGVDTAPPSPPLKPSYAVGTKLLMEVEVTERNASRCWSRVKATDFNGVTHYLTLVDERAFPLYNTKS